MSSCQEEGVFDALSHGYVKAAQFFISADENDPQSVLEKYIFKFKYVCDQNGHSERVHSVEVLSSTQSVVVSAMESFKGAIARLIHELRSMPSLPGK